MTPNPKERFFGYLAQRPRWGMSKGFFHYGEKKDVVKFAHYIELPTHVKKYIIVDIDYEGGCASWIENDLPLPTIAIINRSNFHGLLFYELKTTVAFPIKGRNKCRLRPIRYYQAVRNAYVKKLGGDFGYSGACCKNPFSNYWYTIWNNVTYTLEELAEYVELKSRYNPNSNYGFLYGRHMEMFHSCRFEAYQRAKDYNNYEDFEECVHQICLDHFNSVTKLIESDHDFPESEALSIANSIAGWTWPRKDDPNFSQYMKNTGAANLAPITIDKDSSEYFKTVSNHKSQGAHYTNQVRTSKTEASIRNTCQLLLDSNQNINAKAVSQESGLSLPTVYRYKNILNEYISNNIISIMSV